MSTLGMLNGLKSWSQKPNMAGMSRAVVNSARGLRQDMGLNLAQSILIDKQL